VHLIILDSPFIGFFPTVNIERVNLNAIRESQLTNGNDHDPITEAGSSHMLSDSEVADNHSSQLDSPESIPGMENDTLRIPDVECLKYNLRTFLNS